MLNWVRYTEIKSQWPLQGRHVLASFDDDVIVVYQAFNESIAKYAVEKQTFLGCPGYCPHRMTWIKTNFLWMMYRCGWCMKDANQSRVLAIHLMRSGFDEIIRRSVDVSLRLSVDDQQFESSLKNGDVRCQWDPDHDPSGEKEKRRAIQLGLKGSSANEFVSRWIVKIEDITDDFVVPQAATAQSQDWSNLMVPFERVYLPLHQEVVHD
jgi:hypothetical protein